MKMTWYGNACSILFEEGEKFAGKEIMITGEGNYKGLFFHGHNVDWMVRKDVPNSVDVFPIDENLKDELITYIVVEGKKQGCLFHPQ